uniref:Uncharacterized protein n=1 Tax=Xiphophorus couchianus TaxID=32473 RepID=A0A3B5MM15_9TELE
MKCSAAFLVLSWVVLLAQPGQGFFGLIIRLHAKSSLQKHTKYFFHLDFTANVFIHLK